LLIGITPSCKRLIIDPSAFFKLLLKNAPLAVGEIDAVFECLTHYTPFGFQCSAGQHRG
jgi:hypothetical protein